MRTRHADGGPSPANAPTNTPTKTPTNTPANTPANATRSSTDSLRAPLRAELPQLTGLRFVAAVWVLLHHTSFMPLDAYASWLAPVRPLLAAGPLGVDLFFVLSGMVLARSYLERWRGAPSTGAVGRYVWARLARVWPLYAVVVVGFGLWCTARLRFGGDGIVAWQLHQPGLGLPSWLAQLTMTQLWTSPGIDGISFVLPAWSVSAEFAAYLVFPLIAVGCWRLRRWPRPVLATLATAVSATALLVAMSGVTDWLWALRLAGGFVAGVLVWLVVRRVSVTPSLARWANVVAVGVVVELVVVAYWAASAPASAAVPASTRLLLAVPLFPVLIGALAVADPSRGVAGWLARPVMLRGGRASYALYLVHFPLLEVALVVMTRFPVIGPHTAAAALLVPNLVPAALVLGWAAHRWVEEPARVWMLRHTPAGRTVPARVLTLRPAPVLEDTFRRVGRTPRDEGAVGADAADALRTVAGRRGGSHAARGLPSPALAAR